ncbi:MAG: alpha/beta fold hydrolase [Anaerolineae bacterium]|nr:alpha/beta fold hydrolase [Anaerolineae bacterium]
MVTFPLVDTTMHYSVHGEGTPVLALHAATVEGSALRWLVRALTGSGLQVITPDQRGHGQTANPASDLRLSRLVDDNVTLINGLELAPVHAFGYSMGAAVNLYTARRLPEMFRSLVLLGAGYRAPSDERLLRVLGPEEMRRPIVRRVFDRDTGIVAGWGYPAEVFHAITCPVLIVMADRDEFNDPDDGLALYRALPNAELLVVPHCGHFDLVNHPLVVSTIQDFYRRVID